jgi:hypothetical protein
MKHRATPRSCTVAVLLWSCTALFAARVIGQFEALSIAPDWLPAMDAWYSGLLPYYLLLPAQIILLMVMAVVAWNRRVRTARFAAAKPRVARALRMLALLYFLVMALRLAVDLVDNGTEFWRHGAIPVAFHWVLALFLLVSARASPYSPADTLHVRPDEIDEPHGDVPALAQALLRLPDYPSNYRAAGSGSS